MKISDVLSNLAYGSKDLSQYRNVNEWTGDCKHSNDHLVSLRGAPKKVNGYFDCSDNRLKSLHGAPRVISSTFSCSDNKLKSLEGGPEEVGDYWCHNNNLTSLKGVAKKISITLDCRGNQLTSLDCDIESVDSIDCKNNYIRSFKNIHKHIKHCKRIYSGNNPIESCVLGLLLIDGFERIYMGNDVEKIVNKYLPNTRGMEAVFECQEELIEAGYEDFAQL